MQRWALSQRLPQIVRDLMGRKVFHTNVHGTYITIQEIDENGNQINYEIYLELSRRNGKTLNLVVSSAFPRDADKIAKRPREHQIRFAVLVFNTQSGKPIRRQHQ